MVLQSGTAAGGTGRVVFPVDPTDATSGIITAAWRGGGTWITAGPTTGRSRNTYLPAWAQSEILNPWQSVAQPLSVAPGIGSSWQQTPVSGEVQSQPQRSGRMRQRERTGLCR